MKKVSFLGDILVCIMLLITTTAAITFAWFSDFDGGESNVVTTGTFILKLNNEEVVTQQRTMPEVRFNASTLYSEAADPPREGVYLAERDGHFNELVASFSFMIENAGSLPYAVSIELTLEEGANAKQPQLHFLYLPDTFKAADGIETDVAAAIEGGDYRSLIRGYLRSAQSGAGAIDNDVIDSSNERTLIERANQKYRNDMTGMGGLELAAGEKLNVYCLLWVCGYNCTHPKDAAGECIYNCGHRKESLGADVNFADLTMRATIKANQVDGGYE